jgi:hypothetical protein
MRDSELEHVLTVMRVHFRAIRRKRLADLGHGNRVVTQGTGYGTYDGQGSLREACQRSVQRLTRSRSQGERRRMHEQQVSGRTLTATD